MNNIYDDYSPTLPLGWIDNNILQQLLDYHYDRIMSKKEGKITEEEHTLANLVYDVLTQENQIRIERGTGQFNKTNLPESAYEGWKVNEMKNELSKKLKDIEI